ncbi:hypothetical protein KDA_51440 [Dictyobacter alpinus]|uniref:Uncharacterized protein n=1 Tax=Dictyobacter alpinus TaxID=2014873 RepID=A0A402BED5_9CHLR|nr:hypothetical protein [Dictyobacter alpinus]GCE29660.1 hypothetical protein KDA_51440 [Dictyobacter alpinus]
MLLRRSIEYQWSVLAYVLAICSTMQPETVTMLQDLGVKAQAVQADLNAPSVVTESKRMVEDVAEHFGRLG